jgi:hypothetical protein
MGNESNNLCFIDEKYRPTIVFDYLEKAWDFEFIEQGIRDLQDADSSRK